MEKPNLNSLNPARFLELIGAREKMIAAADSNLPSEDKAVNRLADALHPRSQHLIVSKIIEHSPDVKSYICMPDTEMGTKGCAYFSAGQYISVSVEIDGQKHSRPYSLSSAPKQSLGGYYRITVKAVDGGLVSKYILDNFAVGTRFEASAPAGNFTYEPLRDAKNVIGIAGGSGITPFISMAKAIADGDEDFHLTVLYGCRTESDILFRNELDILQDSSDKVRVVYVLSDEDTEGFEHGYITSELITKYADKEPYSVFVCGPKAMTDYLGKELQTLNLRRKYIRYELRGESGERKTDGSSETVCITVRAGGRSVKLAGKKEDTILRTLEKAGITPPTSCRSGECGFCRSKLISGEVYIMDETDKRRMADKKFGYIHPCCTYALGNIEIEVSATLPTKE